MEGEGRTIKFFVANIGECDTLTADSCGNSIAGVWWFLGQCVASTSTDYSTTSAV